MKPCSKILSVCLIFLAASAVTGTANAADRYALAQRFAKQGNYEFALMAYRDVVRDSRSPLRVNSAIFAQGEYFFLEKEYGEAQKNFMDLLSRNPRSDVKLFALGYLWKIAGETENSEEQQRYAQEIVAEKQVSMIFRKSKTYRYTSPLYRQHSAVFGIDQIELNVNNKPFATIHY